MSQFALILVAFAAINCCQAMQVPAWIERGILMVETRSTINKNGEITYQDQRTGKVGELGPYQMTRAAFEVIEKNEPFEKLRTDTVFARKCFQRYMAWLYADFSNRDWAIAATRWNVGPHGSLAKGMGYRYAVEKAGK